MKRTDSEGGRKLSQCSKTTLLMFHLSAAILCFRHTALVTDQQDRSLPMNSLHGGAPKRGAHGASICSISILRPKLDPVSPIIIGYIRSIREKRTRKHFMLWQNAALTINNFPIRGSVAKNAVLYSPQQRRVFPLLRVYIVKALHYFRNFHLLISISFLFKRNLKKQQFSHSCNSIINFAKYV